MAKIQLDKQIGSIEDSKTLGFSIVDLPDGELRIRFENATNKTSIFVDGTDESVVFSYGSKAIEGLLNLNISPDSNHSLFSIFIFIDRKIEDEFVTHEILYTSYDLLYERLENLKEKIYLSEYYTDFDSRIKLSLEGKINDKYLIKINNKKFIILTNSRGHGEIYFYAKDVISDKNARTLQKFPVLFSINSNDFVFGNVYINIFPPSIYTKSALDLSEIKQLKNAVSASGGNIIGKFTSLPSNYEIIDLSSQAVPSTLSNDVTTTCIYNSTEEEEEEEPVAPNPIDALDICDEEENYYSWQSNSALLPNGQAVSVVTGRRLSEDSTDKLRNYLISLNISSIPPNDYAFKIYPFIIGMAYNFGTTQTGNNKTAFYFDKEYYEVIMQVYAMTEPTSEENTNLLHISILNREFKYEVFKLPGHEYLGDDEWFPDDNNESSYKRIVVDTGDYSIDIFNLNIKYQIIFGDPDVTGDSEAKPLTFPVTDVSNTASSFYDKPLYDMEYIRDDQGSILSVESAIVVTNNDYYDLDPGKDNFYIYIIASCNVSGNTQLFLKSLKLESAWVGVSDDISWSPDGFKESGWRQITDNANNRNPSASIDKYNNLHIVWESDRCLSDAYQLYYGCVGPYDRYINNAVLFSSIYKQSNIDSSAFSASNCKLFEQDPYRYSNQLLSNWSYSEKDESSVNITKNNSQFCSFDIMGNPSHDEALIFSAVTSDNVGNSFSQDKDSYAIEVMFDLTMDDIHKPDEGKFSYHFVEGEEINDKYIQNQWNIWSNKFIEYNSNTPFVNENLYRYNNNLFVIGKQENVYDKIIPLCSMISQSNIESNTNLNINHKKYFSLGLSALNFYDSENLDFDTMYAAPYFFGIAPEKIIFQATNIESLEEYCDNNGYHISDGIESYIDQENYIIYTGRYKLFMYIRNDHLVENSGIKYSINGENSSYIVRQSSNPFYLDKSKNFKITTYWNKLPSDILSRLLGVNPFDNENDFLGSVPQVKYSGNILVTIDDDVVFTSSFFSERWHQNLQSDNKYNYIGDNAYPVILFGIPHGDRVLTNEILPYQSRIFEDADIQYSFSNVSIGVPTVDLNDNVINLPNYYFDTNNMISPYETNIYWYNDEFDYLDFNLDKFEFPQIPITFSGINTNPYIREDILGNIHLSWNSNRYKIWDIYYSSTYDYTKPFVFDTRISKTSGNSLNPSMDIDDMGNRAIVWQDDTNGKFDIYMAKSKLCANGSKSDNNLNSYESYCISDKIRDRNFNLVKSLIDPYDTGFDLTFYDSFYKSKARVSFDFYGVSGSYKMEMELYSDIDLTKLVKVVYSDDAPELWKSNGFMFNSDGTTELQEGYTYIIEYNAIYDGGIQDKLLFVKIAGEIQ